MSPPHVDSSGIIYNIRVSPRARNVGLRMSVEHGLVIVVPARFDQSEVPAVIARHRRWIEEKQRLMEEQRLLAPPEPPAGPPDRVVLQAINEEWTVGYEPGAAGLVIAREHPGNRVVVTGEVSDVSLCRRVLARWLGNKAWKHLVPWLEAVSRERRLPFRGVTIRNQRTRWGSCTAKKTISLNQKLLFIAPHLVRYILIHELCHTVRLNHGADFWAVVRSHEPMHRQLEVEIDAAWKMVPRWSRAE